MMTVLNCVAFEHSIWLVALAAVVCLSGSWVTLRLLGQAQLTDGGQRLGWHFLTAVAAGASIWSTHFVAMLGYDAGVPITFEPALTAVSLLIAIVGTGIGFMVATSVFSRLAPAIGGAIVGLAISAMHYTGMFAYRVAGLVSWDGGHLAASIVLGVVFGALSLDVALRRQVAASKFVGTGLLVAAIVSLHFTAMAAFQVTPMALTGETTDPVAMHAMALAVAAGGLIIVGTGLASYLIDARTRSDSYERLRHMALNDTLTGLPNRASFTAHLDREIAACGIRRGEVAVIGIDLDRFKDINDIRGHGAGDEVLRELGRRMQNVAGQGEFIARVGGDEFAAVKSFVGHGELLEFIERLEAAIAEPIWLDGFESTAGASFGVATFPGNADSAQLLINNADLAMYRAKAHPNRTVCFFDPSMDEAVRSRRALADDLRKAIENGELEVHYQVQTSVETGEIRGHEALLRWNHPGRGTIPPVEFIPLAEESGIILPLGEWVLRQACADAAAWQSASKVAVNLSPVQFAHANLPKLIHEVLLQTGLAPQRLELELTETTLIRDKSQSLHILRQIKALGVSVALDDFGTGYSSLDTLRTFPFDKIKLDRSFVSEIVCSAQSKAIVRAVLTLARSLDIPVLAEGIETAEQLSVLQSEGCDEAQGFLLGRPVPSAVLRSDVGPPTSPDTAVEKCRAGWTRLAG